MEIDKAAVITIAVKDQDEALSWFTEKLGFVKKSDMQGPGMRWVTVAPAKQAEVEFLLASWFPDLVGKAATMVVHTKDCRETAQLLTSRGVGFTQAPAERPYGVEAVFADLYGNRYALIEPRG